MAQLEVDDGFDVHQYREELKLLQQERDSMHFRNRGALGCPACGRDFDRLLVAETATVTFDSAPTDPFCLVRAPDRLLVLTHP